MTKTYNFTINKKNTSSNNTSSNTSYINALISSNLKKAVPYLFGTIDDDYREEIVITPKKPKKTIDIDITIKNKPKAKKYTSLNFEDYSDFMKAIEYLSSIDSYDDSADFYLPDGTPVRIFEDEIQIGYELISFRKMNKNMFANMTSKSKKAIIDIYFNI